MPRRPDDEDGSAVPHSRLSRLAGLGGMAAGIAGDVALHGVRQLAAGKRPKASDLFLTPSNAMKLTRQLSQMRGAAMKIGQMISMDSGDFLPKEFADILARLRADAKHMPRKQLMGVLDTEWGRGWRSRYKSFDMQPIAAASIGQVHRAKLPDGTELAIKIQYPGVKDSIDSDVKNVAALLRMSGLVPASLDVAPIIEEGRKQLHQEADYEREAAYMSRFAQLLKEHKSFEVPQYYPDISTDKVLAMSFHESIPIEDMVSADQETRDTIISRLMELTLRELFDFKLMQTDPNFANYRYNETNEKIVLLDFGACRDVYTDISKAYGAVMQAALANDADAVYEAAIAIGFIPKDIKPAYRKVIMELITMVLEPLSEDGLFDFGDNTLAQDLRDTAMPLATKRELWHIPQPDIIFIQRKLGGIYMLATRLKARVDVRGLIERYIPN